MITTKIDMSHLLTDPWGHVTKPLSAWLEANEIGEVYALFGSWGVSSYGLEHLTIPPYFIKADRLWEGEGYYGWSRHMSEKIWVDMDDFEAALVAAREYHAQARGKH